MTNVISIANQKGGVGKTTTTMNLAYSLVQKNNKVLIVDLDSQSNLTNVCGILNPYDLKKSLPDLFIKMMNDEDIDVKNSILKLENNIDLLGTNIKLSTVDLMLKSETGSEFILKNILDTIKDSYDYILIDTAPSLSSLTINALVSSDYIIIPVNLELFALMGLNDFLKTVNKIKKRLNSKLEILGVVITMCDERLNLSKAIELQLKEIFKNTKIFDTKIKKTVKIGEANYHNKAIGEYQSNSEISKAYEQLAKEVIDEIK